MDFLEQQRPYGARMTTRRWGLAAVVFVSIVTVLVSAFLWVIGLIGGSGFMASTPSQGAVVGGVVVRVIAVLLWGLPVVVARQELGARAARTTAVLLGSCLAVALTLTLLGSLW